MNKQTDKNGQQNILLKNVIQASVILCLKAKRVPLAHRGAVWLSTWRNSRCQSVIQLTLYAFYKHFSETNENTKKKSTTN